MELLSFLRGGLGGEAVICVLEHDSFPTGRLATEVELRKDAAQGGDSTFVRL
jgi:hypothetical protein